MPKSSPKNTLSTPFAVVILVGITVIICVGLYWLYLVTYDEQKALAQDESYRVSAVTSASGDKITPITLGAVENDFIKLEQTQSSVDNGSGPWRLDPLAVATADGVALGFDQENDEFTLVSKVDLGEYSGTGEAIIKAVHDGVTYEIQLIQPVKQGAVGIWAINSVNKK